jgi:hypothetical protein
MGLEKQDRKNILAVYRTDCEHEGRMCLDEEGIAGMGEG